MRDGFSLAGWDLMAHGLAFGGYDYQGSRRGGGQVFSTNWAMLMAQHDFLGGEFGARLMMSGEEFTDGGRGYPLLLQSGETFHGVPNHDRQHPHDLFMEMAATYTHSITKDLGFQLYGGPVGEPALGPVAAPHRESAAADPFAPLGHHWMDSTHVTFGVVTAGIFTHNVKLEASWFNGREPDSNRSNFDFRRMDSYSTRLSYNPTRDLSLQTSWGYLKSPEQLEPDVSVNRITSSATYNLRARIGGQLGDHRGMGPQHSVNRQTHRCAAAREQPRSRRRECVFRARRICAQDRRGPRCLTVKRSLQRRRDQFRLPAQFQAVERVYRRAWTDGYHQHHRRPAGEHLPLADAGGHGSVHPISTRADENGLTNEA